MDGLPEYMKVIYSKILDFYNELEVELRKDGQSYRVNYAKEVLKIPVRTYFKQAKWFNDGYIPTFEEYVQTASISIACSFIIVSSLVGMRGDVVTKEVFDWAMKESNKLVKASNLIGRLLNDMKSHKFEQERGHICSAVECYMKQYDNVSEEDVYDEFKRRMVEAWKDMNEEFMKLRMTTAAKAAAAAAANAVAVPLPVLLLPVNLVRIVELFYLYKDGFTLPHEVLKENITSLFFNPIPM
ncbi:probable sesquiterpene synthase [Macadamia integrifolia]|uniref:probable sesquiterpene synthase n=1 Tax=Macadamia integrifolia TaxID=60698 RepID=UPI001C4F357B|nr:probable sesquiterpene synthase [Macadamia integrifolia]